MGRAGEEGGARLCASLHDTFSRMYTMCESCMQDVMCLQMGHATLEMCATLPVVQSFVSLTIHTHYIVFQTASCCPVLEGGLSLFSYPPNTRGASTTANGQQQLQGEGQGRGSPHRHRGTQHHIQVGPTTEICVVL